MEDPVHPANVIGRIVGYSRDRDYYKYTVEWDTGGRNCYSENDLFMVKIEEKRYKIKKSMFGFKKGTENTTTIGNKVFFKKKSGEALELNMDSKLIECINQKK